MRRPLLWVTAALMVSGCGVHAKDAVSNGVIASIDGDIRKLSEADAGPLCERHYCEPNYVYEATFGKRRKRDEGGTPRAPSYPAEQLDWSRERLRMKEAWAVTEGSSDVVVAVVDTGVAIGHPDLAPNIWRDADGNAGHDFANGRPNAVDDNGHGTHVAGIIAAARNGIGVVGIAPRARIMPVKFLNASGFGDSDAAIHAIRYAADHGARIISNSWGGGGESVLLDAAIQYARAKDAIVVAAAGNESSDNDARPEYPAGYAGVVSVGSSDESDGLSHFSNFGRNSVAVTAPGSDILSSFTGDSWRRLSGTSMATPQVSGALALALALDPGRDPARLVQDLCDTAQRKLTDRVRCGMLDVLGLVKRGPSPF